MPEKIKGKTPENTQLNFEQLAQLFPSCVIETTGAGAVSADARPNEDKVRHTINWQALADLVGVPLDDALSSDNRREPFGFSWTGKKKAIRESMGAISKALRPCLADSKDWDSTSNLYLEGDNLDALKLLQGSYLTKIKMILKLAYWTRKQGPVW